MNGYKTVEKESVAEFTEKKSRFIGYACPVKTEEEALAFVNKIKKKHTDARHNVYAYVVRENNIQRFSDDGEPQGTAGIPVLDTIRKQDLTD
ncbi:MAG: YigZ family protein, partial [Clostridia bacterium]|nr:YigZ family protein [Clostridia bacterium]